MSASPTCCYVDGHLARKWGTIFVALGLVGNRQRSSSARYRRISDESLWYQGQPLCSVLGNPLCARMQLLRASAVGPLRQGIRASSRASSSSTLSKHTAGFVYVGGAPRVPESPQSIAIVFLMTSDSGRKPHQVYDYRSCRLNGTVVQCTENNVSSLSVLPRYRS